MKPWLKSGPVEPGDFSIIWLNNVATYAICTELVPDVKPNWFDVEFLVFDRIPPHSFGWKITYEHLAGEIFHINNVPIAIVPLELTELAPFFNSFRPEDQDDPDLIKENKPFE